MYVGPTLIGNNMAVCKTLLFTGPDLDSPSHLPCPTASQISHCIHCLAGFIKHTVSGDMSCLKLKVPAINCLACAALWRSVVRSTLMTLEVYPAGSPFIFHLQRKGLKSLQAAWERSAVYVPPCLSWRAREQHNNIGKMQCNLSEMAGIYALLKTVRGKKKSWNHGLWQS